MTAPVAAPILDKNTGKLLFLLRHATAESTAERDHVRPLMGYGLQEAKTLGELWAEKLLWPDIIICSDAVRTRQTLQQLCRGAGTALPEIWEPRLYDASPGDAIDLMHDLPEDAQSALFVGHNPTIHQLAAMLPKPEDCLSNAGKALLQGYAPCTLTVLQLPEASTAWDDVAPATLRLRALHHSSEGWHAGVSDQD